MFISKKATYLLIYYMIFSDKLSIKFRNKVQVY